MSAQTTTIIANEERKNKAKLYFLPKNQGF